MSNLGTRERRHGQVDLNEPPTAASDWPAMVLAVLFVGSGLAHFVFPDTLVKAIPEWLPHRPLLVTVSGILEIAGGIGLVVPASRRIAGWCLVALLVAVFPANMKMLASARATGSQLWVETLLWMRLPLQPLLIWLVYRYAVSPLATRPVVGAPSQTPGVPDARAAEPGS